MIYVIVILLLILVLSNDKARVLLLGLTGFAFWLVIIGAILLALVIGGVWGYKQLFDSPKLVQQTSVPPPIVDTPKSQQVHQSNNTPNSIKFIVKNICKDGMSIQYRFFDESNKLMWPSSDKVYTTSQNQTPNIHALSCNPGSTICFGATTYSASPTVYWGVGISNAQLTNLDTSCVICGSVTEKYLNFSCPVNNSYNNQLKNPPETNKKNKFKSRVIKYELPPPTSSRTTTITNTTTNRDYRALDASNNGISEPPSQAVTKLVEFSELSSSQQDSLKLSCFEARTKGQLQFDECIKEKLSAYK